MGLNMPQITSEKIIKDIHIACVDYLIIYHPNYLKARTDFSDTASITLKRQIAQTVLDSPLSNAPIAHNFIDKMFNFFYDLKGKQGIERVKGFYQKIVKKYLAYPDLHASYQILNHLYQLIKDKLDNSTNLKDQMALVLEKYLNLTERVDNIINVTARHADSVPTERWEIVLDLAVPELKKLTPVSIFKLTAAHPTIN